jgi:hypothetical protein
VYHKNFKYCGDCVKAGISCFPSFTFDGNKPVKETFCKKAYKEALGAFYRSGGKIVIKKKGE